MSRVAIAAGSIHTYNDDSGYGLIETEDGKIVFRSVDFSSGRPPRFPVVGEAVEVVLLDGLMVSVRVPNG
jgi:hypothetical protein